MIRARLLLFGEQSLTVGPAPQGRVVDLQAAPARLLLAYLALYADQPIDRRHLAFTLWPDERESLALRNLRQHLHRLRRSLTSLNLPEDILVSQGHQLRFQSSPTLWVDVPTFQRQIIDPQWQIEAIELYRGDLLAHDEASWLPPLRARLREQYLEGLRTQIAMAHMQRNYLRALYYIQRLLQAEPLRESSHRIYMEALYLNGQRVQALQHFDDLKSLLQRELKADPMPQTVELHRHMQNGSLPGDIPLLIASTQQAPQALRTMSQISASFVGRRGEVAQLDEALAQTLRGRGQLVLIEGESGLGKTRLLQTWQQARAGPMLSFTGQGQRGQAVISCALIIEALRRSYNQIDRRWLPAHAPWLDRWMAASDPAGRAAEPRTINALSACPPAVDELGQFLLTLAARAGRPIGLFLDDLHHADDATWQLLAFLGRRCMNLPLLLVGAYQPRALSITARRLVHNLQRHEHLQRIELLPFSPADTAKLVAHLLNQAQPDRIFVNRLYRATEGNPFFITEFLKTTRTAQDFSPETALHLPKTVQVVIKARLNELQPTSQILLALAAAIGPTFNFRVLAAVARQFSEEDVLAALESWLEKGLVEEQDDGYKFTHEQIQRVAYEEMDEMWRHQAHGEIAQALTLWSSLTQPA